MAISRDELGAAIDRFPRTGLADLPTPLHDCPRFSAALGGKVRVLVKRDDLTGLAFGGNKTRKFDLALGDAVAQGATAVITGAASQSNHARQAAAAAACNANQAMPGLKPPIAPLTLTSPSTWSSFSGASVPTPTLPSFVKVMISAPAV